MSIAPVGAGIEVERPVCTPPPFGLLSVSAVEDVDDGHWLAGVHHEQPDCTADLMAVALACEPHTKEQGAVKGVTFPESTPFTLVSGYSCGSTESIAEADRRARERFDLHESKSLEFTFWLGRDYSGADILGSLGAPAAEVTVLPDAPDITHAVSALEAWAALNIACLPVLHVPPALAAPLDTAHLATVNGPHSLVRRSTGGAVAVGQGYSGNGPQGTTTPDGTAWLYVSGPIRLLRSPVVVVGPQASWVNRANNDVTVYVERSYVAVRSCGVAAVRVTI